MAARLYDRLHPVMGALGLLFLVLVLGQRFATGGWAPALGIAVVVLWAVFIAEYLLRLVIAPSTPRFLAKTWWQVLLLLVPVFSAIRAVLVLRAARPARVLAASVRGSRSARATLSGRIGWLALVTVIVVFAGADLLYEVGRVRPYGTALHHAAVAGISGESIADGGELWPSVIDVALSIYSAVVFAALAGSLGAYFLERRREDA